MCPHKQLSSDIKQKSALRVANDYSGLKGAAQSRPSVDLSSSEMELPSPLIIRKGVEPNWQSLRGDVSNSDIKDLIEDSKANLNASP